MGAQNATTLVVWNTRTWQEVRRLHGPRRGLLGVAFSTDGKFLAGGGWEKDVLVWDLHRDSPPVVLHGHTELVYKVAFAPHGPLLASASEDGTAILWDVVTAKAAQVCKGHKGAIYHVAFTSDGKRLATVSWDGTMKLWDTSTGHEVLTLRRASQALVSVAFSSDSRAGSPSARFATGDANGTICLTDVRPLTPEVEIDRHAEGLVRFLIAKPLPWREVRTILQQDRTITDTVRHKALAFLERFAEENNPQKYHTAAWTVLRHPYANAFQCQFALAQMQAASERTPHHLPYRRGLGIAQYRLGKYQQPQYAAALATLSACDDQHPMTLAFLAMTQHRLGNQEQAQTTLALLREKSKTPPWLVDRELQPLLQEATELIEGAGTVEKP